MKAFSICFFSFIVLINSSNAYSFEGSSNELIMCVDHYPPLQVILPNGEVTGENVEVAKAFIKRIGMEIKFTDNTPFKRCIAWLEIGHVDIMVGVLDSEKRKKDFYMYLYDDITVKSFFSHKNSRQIKSFEDLKGLNIAILRGVKQAKLFDQAPSGYFNIVEVSSLFSAFAMLEKGRLDAVVCTDYYGEQILLRTPSFAEVIVKSTYTMTENTQTYIAVSKRSKNNINNFKFQQVAKNMFESKEFMKIIFDFQYNYPQYY